MTLLPIRLLILVPFACETLNVHALTHQLSRGLRLGCLDKLPSTSFNRARLTNRGCNCVFATEFPAKPRCVALSASATTSTPSDANTAIEDSRLRNLAFRHMARYMWPKGEIRTKFLLIASLSFLFVGKLLNAQVPFILQRAVDTSGALIPLGLFILYGASRVATVAFTELKTATFAHVSQRALRRFSNTIFSHLHVLDASFHNENPSGLLSVAYVRGVRGFQAVLFQLVFAVVPTVVELAITSAVLTQRCGAKYALATLATFVSYCAFTSWMTEWRMRIRRRLVDVDNARNAYFVDAMANAETVKLFANEAHEAQRFDAYLAGIQKHNIRNTYAIALLNLGQALIFSTGLAAVMVFTAREVAAGQMSVGSIVAVNGLLLQLQQPFNFIGYTYQEIRQGFVDMRFMLELLQRAPEVQDTAGRELLMRELEAKERTAKLEEGEEGGRQAAAALSGGLAGSMFGGFGLMGGGVAALKKLKHKLFSEPDYAADALLATWLQQPSSPPLPTDARQQAEAVHGAAPAPSSSPDSNLLVGEGDSVLTLPEVRGEIEFRDVSFAYDTANATMGASAATDLEGKKQTMQLRGVSFKVKPGETVALVGSSGSGKSTCLKLITRLHDATAGQVLLDGVDVRRLPLSEVRKRIGVVTQDTTLFDNTVAYNIRYGDLSAGDEEVQSAAEAALVHDAILAQEGGYERRVGERGARLSGGERQRVAIARTVLRKPAVMLCDEVTSAVDAETEVGIVGALKAVNARRTCVMVAHRLASIAHADRILVMRHGQVVEQGTHEELVVKPPWRGSKGDFASNGENAEGFYSMMWRMQHSDPTTASSLPGDVPSPPSPQQAGPAPANRSYLETLGQGSSSRGSTPP